MSLTDTRPDVRRVTGLLQPPIVDLVELHAQAKQLHWCVVGPGFATLHPALDAIAAEASAQADALAERMRALGGLPDARTATVVSSTTLMQPPAGEVLGAAAALHVVRALRAAVASLLVARGGLEDVDPATTDLLHAGVLALEKHAWLLSAESFVADRPATSRMMGLNTSNVPATA